MTDSAIVTLSNPRSAAAEAYRTLRTNLEFASIDHPLHTLLVTSAAPTENRSIAVANLAVALCGPLFVRTTGAQIPMDGGNERVI